MSDVQSCHDHNHSHHDTWLLVCRLMNTFSCRPRRCSARPAERPGMENGDDGGHNDNDVDDHNDNDGDDHNDNDGDDHNDLLDNHWDNDHKQIK